MAQRKKKRDALNQALAYSYHGFSVIPVEPKGKRPLLLWQEFQHRPPTAEEVQTWFLRTPEANVAIVTGRVSGLVVLDVDLKHGGGESLSILEQIHGALPATVEARTGSGGRHLYFAHPGGVVRNRVGLRPGVDLRGDGGYVVAPPSLHPSGGRYVWMPERSPEELPLAATPAWLLKESRGERAGHPLSYWRMLVREGVDEGQRNCTIASLAGHLLWRGVDPLVILDLLLCWNAARCRPPLPEDEVVRTVESITRLHLRH